MTYKDYKDMMGRARAGETVSFSDEDYADILKYEYMDRKAVLLPMLHKKAEAGDWEGVCSLAELNHEVMPEAFAIYYKYIPQELRRDFVVGCYSHHGDSVAACRKALRELPRNGINELPKRYATKKEITVYRAGEEPIELAQYRLSWTLDIGRARFFLNDYIGKHAAHLYRGTIEPRYVIAYTNDRAEKEVLQYRHVRNIVEIKRKERK